MKKEFIDLQLSTVARPSFQSDMYFITPEIRTFWLYEIEDTHPISRAKFNILSDWIMGEGDAHEWFGRVVVTDRYGLNHRVVIIYERDCCSDMDDFEPMFPPTYKPDAA